MASSIVLTSVKSPMSKEEIEKKIVEHNELDTEITEMTKVLRRLCDMRSAIREEITGQFLLATTRGGTSFVVQATADACTALVAAESKLTELCMFEDIVPGDPTEIFREEGPEFWTAWVCTVDEALALINEPRAKKQKTESE